MFVHGKKGFIYLVLLLILLTAFSAMASRTRGGVLFLLIGPGARATGMGEAFVAIADDPTATYWNPAGLGQYPLSSQWLDLGMPPGERVVSVAADRTGLIDIDYKSFDVWAATDAGLFLRKGRRWVGEERYSTAEGETMTDALFHFISEESFDSTAINERIIPAVLSANDMGELPEGPLRPDTRLNIPFSALIDGNITALLGARRELWVGTDNGLYRRVRGRWERLNQAGGPGTNHVTALSLDDRDFLYVGTKNGLFVLSGSRWRRYTTGDGLPSNEITTLYTTGHRDIWAGTKAGPARLSGERWESSFKFEPTGDVDWHGLVRQVFPLHGDKAIEHASAEIIAINEQLDRQRPAPGTRVDIPFSIAFPSAVTAIFVDRENTVWFGTEMGLKSFDGTRWQVFGWESELIEEEISIENWARAKWPRASENLIKNLVRALRYQNRINAQVFDAGKTIEFPSSPLSGHITAIERAPDGDLLVGTEFGTMVYDYKKARFTYYDFGGLKDDQLVDVVRHGNEYWYNTGDRVAVYSKGKHGLSFMHVQWLPELAPDLYYEFLGGTTFLEGWGTVGGAITYINTGSNEWTDEDGTVLGTFSSYELAASAVYGTKVTDNLSTGLAFKVIYSALAKGVRVGMEQKEGVATTFAVDGGILYQTPLPGLTLGAAVQNLGPDIHYIDAAQADPLPRNLKAGLALRALDTDYNKLTIAADINKSLISWGDDTFVKEFREAVKNIGIEYTYANFISLRGGYMIDYDYIPTVSSEIIRNEPYSSDHWKGIHYFTLGAGLRFRNFAFDFGYIPPQEDEDEGKLVLSNILRYSLSIAF